VIGQFCTRLYTVGMMPVAYHRIGFNEKIEALSGRFPTSVALADALGVSRMTLVNWRNNVDSISDSNRDRIDYLYCREILLPTMSAVGQQDYESEDMGAPLPERFFDEPHIIRKLVERLSFGSLEIETGARESDFNRVIREDAPPSRLQTRGLLEINNIYHTTARLIQQFQANPGGMDSRMIREWHAQLMSGVRDDAGFYSSKIRVLPDTDLQLTAPEDIPAEVDYWIGRYAQVSGLADIAHAHAHFELIHPFGDGNGRIGRLIMLWHSMQVGVSPPLISKQSKALYYATLEHAQTTGQIAPLQSFLGGQSRAALKLMTGRTIPGLRMR